MSCECRQAKRNCTSCRCLNLFQRWGKSGILRREQAKGGGACSCHAKNLNFEEKRGEDKNDDDNTAPQKDGTSQPSNSVNPGDKKTEMEEEQAQTIGDLPGYMPTEVNMKLKEVYGNYLHQNDGSHLDGGILDDAIWQER